MTLWSVLFFLLSFSAFAQEECAPTQENKLSLFVLQDPKTIFLTVQEAIEANSKTRPVVKTIDTGFKTIPKFPSFSRCPKSFFRVATISTTIDEIISTDGWKSGWARREDELKKNKEAITDDEFDALPKSASMEERIIEYVRVKDVPSTFPKNSSVVGVLENPIRTFSVGYHTGYNEGINGAHMRMDEIEVGECARAPECRRLKAYDSTKVFADRKLTPRYTTEGEWAIDTQIPAVCVVATYRIKFQKVDDKCYSDSNSNCHF